VEKYIDDKAGKVTKFFTKEMKDKEPN